MCLRFVFLLTTRAASWPRLSRREETWKTAEILILRHQLAVLQRRQPRRQNLTWADRALLATLLSVIPKARRQGLRLLITPDTVLRWHRDIVRRRWAARPPAPPAATFGHGSAGGPVRTPAGVSQDPRRARRPGGQGRSVHRLGDPQGRRHRPRPAADRAGLITIPALPGRGDPGLRLLHRRPARRYTGLRPGRNRARIPAHPNHRHHPASHRGMDHPAGPQPGDGSWRAGAPGQVHDPRPRLELHRRIRRRPRRRRDPDRALQHPDTPHERDHRTLDRRMPPRTPGPHPHLEPGTPATDPAPVRDPPQSAPTAPLPARRRAAETATRTVRPRPVPHPKTSSGRRPDQRISPGGMRWTRLSARTVHPRSAAPTPPHATPAATAHSLPPATHTSLQPPATPRRSQFKADAIPRIQSAGRDLPRIRLALPSNLQLP